MGKCMGHAHPPAQNVSFSLALDPMAAVARDCDTSRERLQAVRRDCRRRNLPPNPTIGVGAARSGEARCVPRIDEGTRASRHLVLPNPRFGSAEHYSALEMTVSSPAQLPMAALADRILRREAEIVGWPADLGVQLCARLITHIGRVIGDSGARIVFERSVRLVQIEFPLLVGNPKGKLDLWLDLRVALEAQAPDVSGRACSALVATFIGNLSTFIGAGLTERLLEELWPGAHRPTQESS